MPYTVRKAKCKRSDGTSGSWTMSYTTKSGKKRKNCHKSKKSAQAQISAIEMGESIAPGDNELRSLIREFILESSHPRLDGWVNLLKNHDMKVHVDMPSASKVVVTLQDKGRVRGVVEARIAATAKDAAGDARTPPAPCAPKGMRVWSVKWSNVEPDIRGEGWGSLLYEVVLEVVSGLGGLLASDRESVSPKAERIWFSWLEKRADAKWVQLDDAWNIMTSNIDDNCVVPIDDPDSAGGWGGPLWKAYTKLDRHDPRREEVEDMRVVYEKSPLMKAWRKEGSEVANSLSSAGLIITSK
jgi:hypothetical protein